MTQRLFKYNKYINLYRLLLSIISRKKTEFTI